MKAMRKLELFRCEPLAARLTPRACAQNYWDAQVYHGRRVEMWKAPSRAYALGPCRGCEMGRAHAEAVDPGGLDRIRKRRAPSPPNRTPDVVRQQAIEAALRRDRTIRAVAREFGVSQTSLRAWLKDAGYDAATWPKGRPGPRPLSSAAD